MSFTAKQNRFIDEYVVCLNATRAAIRAGHSEKTAYQIGYENLRKPEIAAEIKRRLEERIISAESAAKLISDIATSNLNDFMVVEKVLHTPKVRKPLPEIIQKLKEEVAFEDEYALRARLSEDELKRHEDDQKDRQRNILRLEMELERNPDAYRDVPGEPEWKERVKPDLVALSKSKEQGRIKKLKFTEFGPEVELYPADAAADKLLAYYGKLVTKAEFTGKDGKPLIPKSEADPRIDAIIDKLNALG